VPNSSTRSRLTEDMVTRQVMAHLAKGPDPVLLSMRRGDTSFDIVYRANSNPASLRRTEGQAAQHEAKVIPVSIPAKQVTIPIHKGKIDAFDWTRVELLRLGVQQSIW
jgi:hypothetical protein